MKLRFLIPLGGAALLLAACIPSVNPFYTEKDLVNRPELIGEWQETGKTNDVTVWKFEPGEGMSYKLTVHEPKEKQGEFSAHLFRIQNEYFLDLIPTDCKYAANEADLTSASMFPGHLLAHVKSLEPNLKLAFFNFDWLQKHLESHPKALAHRSESKGILLTAETRALQKFVAGHLAEGELFDKYGELARKP